MPRNSDTAVRPSETGWNLYERPLGVDHPACPVDQPACPLSCLATPLFASAPSMSSADEQPQQPQQPQQPAAPSQPDAKHRTNLSDAERFEMLTTLRTQRVMIEQLVRDSAANAAQRRQLEAKSGAGRWPGKHAANGSRLVRASGKRDHGRLCQRI